MEFDLSQYLFEPLTRAKAFFLGYDLMSLIPRYEPRVAVNNVDVTAHPQDGCYRINLNVTLKDFNKAIDVAVEAIKSKSKNDISPLSSLSMSLAAKIGVGSLSGVALALYFGGIGSIFWMCIISLLVSINTYIECIIGIKYRDKIMNSFIGGPSFYIKKCLNNKWLSIIYSILIIVTYSGLFLSIQSNTIVNIFNCFNNAIYTNNLTTNTNSNTTINCGITINKLVIYCIKRII